MSRQCHGYTGPLFPAKTAKEIAVYFTKLQCGVLTIICRDLNILLYLSHLLFVLPLVGWLFWGFTFLRDGISICIGLSPREREEEE